MVKEGGYKVYALEKISLSDKTEVTVVDPRRGVETRGSGEKPERGKLRRAERGLYPEKSGGAYFGRRTEIAAFFSGEKRIKDDLQEMGI